MDPLSVTLAVVSLATTVKDLVELGQKIHESFTKVSNNLRSAQHVAEDIKEMVEEIKVFCEDHEDALNYMKDFRLALHGLLGKFRSFETSVLPLLPQMGGRKRDRLFRGWDAWRNNNKIEDSILHLQGDVVKVIRRYIMKSTMRTEVKLESIHQDTSKGLTGISRGLEVVQRGISALCESTTATTTYCFHDPSGGTNDEFNQKVIAFAQSTPSTAVPMLRTPNVITEELMTTAYIKLQVNTIAMAIEELSALRVSAPNSIVKFQLEPYVAMMSMSSTLLRHHVVRQVIGMRDLLDNGKVQTISLDAATALCRLSLSLQQLRMSQESIVVGEWAIMLVRMLDDASGGSLPALRAYLALFLLHQSVRYVLSGDTIQGSRTAEEAQTITQDLRSGHGGEMHFQILYSNVLLQSAELVDGQRAVKTSIKAIQALEVILNIQAFTLPESDENFQTVVQPSHSVLDRLFSLAPPKSTITGYALALQRLGIYLFKDGHPGSAVDLVRLAIAVRRKMVSVHGPEYKASLATALSSLVQGTIASCIPAEELLEMAEECTELLRELADENPQSYARELVFVLWEKASTLENLDRQIEAIATWEEVASLAGKIIQDSAMCATALANMSIQFRRIKKYDDAARTGRLAITTYQHRPDLQAGRYFYLSHSLQQLQRYQESADAARTSVTLYRKAAMRDPSNWMGHVTDSLSNLALCLAVLGDCSEALVAWKESVIILDNFLMSNLPYESLCSCCFPLYIDTLCRYPFIGYNLEDKENCLKVCSTAVQYLRRLSETYTQNTDIVQYLLLAEYRYTSTMLRLGHLRDAQEYLDNWLDVWSRSPAAISKPESAAVWHAEMVLLEANVLDAQGYTKQALLTTLKVHDIVKSSISTFQPSFFRTIESMINEARHQVNLGNSLEAIKVAERAVQLSRDNKLEPTIESLVWSLHGIAFTALSCQEYERTIEAAQEGYRISSSPEWQSSEDEHNIFISPNLLACLSFAEANLGRCTTALEYAHRAVDVSLAIRDRKAEISAMTAERSFMETRGFLADILLATGDLAQARQICNERQAYFTKRVEKRTGEYRDLAPILRMLGILCCSEGRHEEGDAAAQELSQMMKMLGNVFPSLQEQVKIRLRRQTQVPILKVLDDMCQKLDCGHQTDVVSLFAI